MAAPRKVSLRVWGVKSVLRSMEQWKKGVQNRVIRQALKAAGTPVLKAAKQTAPKESGLLKKALGRKSWTGKKRRGAGAVAEILGPRRGMKASVTKKKGWTKGKSRLEDPVNIAHLLEGGAKRHNIMFRRGPHAGRSISHPGLAGRHWMKRAWNSTKGQARAIILAKLRAGIHKEAAKAAAKKSAKR